MRTLVLLALATFALAQERVPDDKATEALAAFEKAFREGDIDAKQNAVFNLHDFPHELVLKELDKLLRHKDPKIRNVAALAIGGQKHDVKKAGDVLMKAYKKEWSEEEVVSSIFEAMAELKYTSYWPEVQPALKDQRNLVVIRILDLLGTNKDWRAFPDLVALYREVLPKRTSWSTGTVNVDTGAEGDADAQAAEAAFNAKYGQGGSKEKAKAKSKANAFDLRNFTDQIRRAVNQITGQNFDNAFDLEEWWADNYIMVAQKAAEMDGKDPASVVPRAKFEQAELKAKIEEERKKIEEQLAKEREQEKK